MIDKRVFSIPNELVREFGTRDPFVLAKEKGIIIKVIHDFVKQRGASAIIMRNKFIFLGNRQSPEMKRMVCGHELGHLLVHEPNYGKEAWVLNHELFDMRDELEYEANVFTANLLIDEEEMFQYLDEGFNLVATASALGINVNLLVLKLVEMNKHQGCNFRISDIPDRKFLGHIPDRTRRGW